MWKLESEADLNTEIEIMCVHKMQKSAYQDLFSRYVLNEFILSDAMAGDGNKAQIGMYLL